VTAGETPGTRPIVPWENKRSVFHRRINASTRFQRKQQTIHQSRNARAHGRARSFAWLFPQRYVDEEGTTDAHRLHTAQQKEGRLLLRKSCYREKLRERPARYAESK